MTATPVLLLTDDPESAEVIRDVLGRLGHALTTTANADAALLEPGRFALLIVDRLPGADAAAGVTRRMRSAPELADVPVLAITRGGEVEERVSLLEAGADDVMAWPFDVRELEARVEALMLRAVRSRGFAPEAPTPRVTPERRSTVIVFLSPKGGVGTTTLAVNTAAALAETAPGKVAILDLDLQWGQVATLLNVTARHSIADLAREGHALSDPQTVKGYAETRDNRLLIFAAPPNADEASLVLPDHVSRLVGSARTLYDTVVVDAGSTFDTRLLAILQHADQLAVPIIPELSALRALVAFLDLLRESGGVAGSLHVVLNQMFAREMITRAQIEANIGTRVAIEMPYDPLVYLRAANEGEPFVQSSPRSLPAERIRQLAAILLEQEVPKETGDGARKRGLTGLLRRG